LAARRDQPVLARQETDLDIDVVSLPTPHAMTVKLGLMLRVGERQPASEHATMPARQLAGPRQPQRLRGLPLRPLLDQHQPQREEAGDRASRATRLPPRPRERDAARTALAMSFNASISTALSATIRFNDCFSRSSSFSRFT
jgi:hypothetical protein